MRCISLWQPWATALFLIDPGGEAVKVDETRGWPTQVRGRIGIHAAKHRLSRLDASYYRDLLSAIGFAWDDLPYGALLGTIEITAVRPAPVAWALRTEAQRLWGDYRAIGDDGKRRYAWTMAAPRLYSRPVAIAGRQTFFEVPDALCPEQGDEIPPAVSAEQLPLFDAMSR